MMAEGKECDPEAKASSAADVPPSLWVLRSFREGTILSGQEDARYLAVFLDKAAIDLFKQQRNEIPGLEALMQGLSHAGVTWWMWYVKTGDLTTDFSDKDPFSDDEACVEPTTWESLAHEDDLKRVLEALERFEETGYSSFDCFFRLSTEVPRWVHARDVLLFLDANKEPISVLGFFFDATESQLAKEHVYWGKELPEYKSEDKIDWLRLLSELDRHDVDGDRISDLRDQCGAAFVPLMTLGSLPAFRLNASLEYIEVNKPMEQLLGTTSEQLFKRTNEEIWGKEAGVHVQERCMRALRGESSFERHIRTVNGEFLDFLDLFYPDWSDDGLIIGVCGVMYRVGRTNGTLEMGNLHRQERIPSAQREAYRKVHVAAQNNGVVLLTGESGSGKDYLARRIHDLSKRAIEPFEIINCAALPRDLAESELFGYEQGAFTGARARKRGRLEVAGMGTVVLDEIGEMPLDLQAKLLTFFDTRCFKRVGGERDIQCGARIIATTNMDLKKAVAEGRFRKDLYYRINVFSIRVPPLRQRLEEIPSILRELLNDLASSLELEQIPQIDGFAMKKLLGYHWPGNVRELENVLEIAIAHADGAQISAEHISFESDEEASSPEDGPTEALLECSDEAPPGEDSPNKELPQSRPPVSDISQENARAYLSGADPLGLPIPLRHPSEEQIRAVHEEFIVRRDESSTDISKRYGVKDSTVRKWFAKYDLPGRVVGRPRKKRTD